MREKIIVDELLEQIVKLKNDTNRALRLLGINEIAKDSNIIAENFEFQKLNSKRAVLDEMLMYLEMLEMILKTDYIFYEFGVFSNILSIFENRFNLNNSIRRNIIFYLFERNINKGILTEEMFFINKDYLFKCDEKERIMINDLINKKGFVESSEILTNDILECHLIMKECYFDKRQDNGELINFTNDDFEKVIACLEKLNINKKFINAIEGNLKNKITCKTYNVIEFGRKDINSNMLSKKEYYDIEQELRKNFYFNKDVNVSDLNNSIFLLKSFSEKEKMRCVFLLRKGGYDIRTIDALLMKVETWNLTNGMNFLDLYNNDFKHMFDYYRDEFEFGLILEEINDIVLVLNSIEEGSLEYLEWIDELKSLVIRSCIGS